MRRNGEVRMAAGENLPAKLSIWEFDYKTELTRRIDRVHEHPTVFEVIDAAWITMLLKTGIIPRKHHKGIVEAVLDYWERPRREHTGFGGIQRHIIAELGVEAGGSLTLARTVPPQRQMMACRRDLSKVMCLAYDFQEALLDQASDHLATLMPGYTHYRHAQPETYGHYLLSVCDALERVMVSLESGWEAMSLNELGCGALAGTSWPIDRDLVSRYLGLVGLIENANDAVAYTDGYVEVVAGLTNLMAVVSRFTLDLNIWSSEEWGFLDVPWVASESTSQSEGGRGKAHSYFMPNKTSNSPFLERARAGAAQVLGTLTEVAAMGMRVSHGDYHEMLHMEDGTLRALEFTRLYLHPLLYTVPRITVFKDAMLAALKDGYACATELANQIVRDHDLDYRTAHEVVYEFVLESKKRRIGAEHADLALLEEASQKVLGRGLGMTEKTLKQSLDPTHFLEVTTSRGGISPAEGRRMLDVRRSRLAEARGRLETRIEGLEQAQSSMLDDLKSLA
jgi:argininosuccinate lyase